MSISARSIHHYQVAIENGRHFWIGDEPFDIGGTDIGPSPYDLLLSSLATCKVITVRMYADRKGWPLESMNITLSHQKVKAKDCDECASTSGFVDIIDCEMTFSGELDADQKERLRQISERCPVHRSITSETIIHSHLATMA